MDAENKSSSWYVVAPQILLSVATVVGVVINGWQLRQAAVRDPHVNLVTDRPSLKAITPRTVDISLISQNVGDRKGYGCSMEVQTDTPQGKPWNDPLSLDFGADGVPIDTGEKNTFSNAVDFSDDSFLRGQGPNIYVGIWASCATDGAISAKWVIRINMATNDQSVVLAPAGFS